MRNGCQWCGVLLVLAGCSGAPSDRTAGSAARDTAASPLIAGGTSSDTAFPVPASPSPSAHPDRLSALAAMRFLAAHPEALVLDVRNPDEWNDDLSHLEGSRQIPLPELPARMTELEAWKAKPVVVVCRAGGRSHTATQMLREAGYAQAMNLEGGLLAWRAAEKVAKSP